MRKTLFGQPKTSQEKRKITIKCVNLVRFLEDTSKMSKISYEGVGGRGEL